MCPRVKVASSYFTDATTDRMAVFAVNRAQRQLVELYRPEIEQKFRVGVQLSTYADPTADEGGNSGGRIAPVHGGGLDMSDGGQILQESQQMWVEIAGDSSVAVKAKEYILSLCDRGTAPSKTMGRPQDRMTITERLPCGFGDLLHGHLDKISTETNTRIERVGRTDELILNGDETRIALALSLIENECSKLRQEQSQNSYGMIQRTLSKDDTPRNRLQDEGNNVYIPSFETDSQNRTLEVRTNKPTEPTSNQSERTHEEPVKLIAHSINVPASDIQPLNTQRQDQKNNSLVSSMQKLGYPKEQVDIILRQLGPDADHNDVLWALVNQNSSKTEFADVVDTKEEAEIRRDMSDGIPSEETADDSDNLRPIIIDGSNVAMSFGNKVVFACKGIEVAVKWFCDRGHKKIHVFVPNWRKEASKPETPITDQDILTRLEQQKFLTWTPSRRSGGRRIVCYDDRYILRTAVEEDGIIVSNDNFRDIQNEKPEWRKVIEERLLMYAFVSDRFMPPDDPLGRYGPSLDNFLRMKPTMPDHLPQACPYGKKCTYGNKCKYYHSDRPNRPMKSISETLKEHDKKRKEAAKLNNERSNSPRFTAASTAPIPGYRPPEEVTTTPDWQTAPLPGANTQWSPQRKSVVSDSITSLVSTKSSSPHHSYAKEPTPQAPYQRDEVYLGQDQQRYHQNIGGHQSLSQVSPRHLNTPPLGRAGHTSPLPNYPSNSQRANQQGMFTVPLQSYFTPNQPERGYAQFEESHNSNRLSMPATIYGSGESLGVNPSGINVERRPSHELVSGFQRLGMQDPQSGMQLPQEPQHSFNNYRQPQYHSGEQFLGRMQQPSHPADNQGTTQPLPYPSRRQSSPMSSDQRMFSPPRPTVSQGYPSHNEPSRQNYPPSPQPMTRGPYRPAEPAKISSSEEQGRQNILHHLSGIFGAKKVEAVMRRHPTETNPQKLVIYLSTNT
ncbi:uncharacterized protein [Asterias amurensis]|uniref:uncharacterized protein isoform X1 n=1 Tax=Asterias amurensis TaxID=7602 RepID=UPI003AB68FF6